MGNALLGRCRVSSSDLKVRVETTDLSTFPDVTVVCGERQLATMDRNAVTNPTLLVEVTSASTEDYDRGEKLRHYKSLPSVQEVLVISHRDAELTLHRRAEASWTTSTARRGESLELSSVAARIAVDDLYQSGLEDAV
jgi:Uma2 family endonuclease